MDRKQQQSDLMMKLGALLSPVEEVSAFPERFDVQGRASMLAKYFAGQHPFTEMARLFCQSEVGHEYRLQYNRINQSLRNLARSIEAHPEDNEQIDQAAALEDDSRGLVDGGRPQYNGQPQFLGVPGHARVHVCDGETDEGAASRERRFEWCRGGPCRQLGAGRSRYQGDARAGEQ